VSQKQKKPVEPTKRGKRPMPRGWPGPGGGYSTYLQAAPEWRGTTVQVCGMWPFAAGTGSPMVGVPIGRNILSGATMCCDPISWFMRAKLISNPSMFVLGKPGLGKSTITRRMALGMVLHDHGHSVGLSAGGAGRAPGAHRPAGAGRDRRQRRPAHEVEVAGLAEEVGLVGGDDVDQVDGLGLQAVLPEQVAAVVVEAEKTRLAHPLAQPALEHGALAGRHLDAAVVVDELGETLEVPLCEAVLLMREGERVHDGVPWAWLLRPRGRPRRPAS